MSDDTDDTDDTTAQDGWEPEPATLRDSEREDVSAHAQRNIEQLRLAERRGDLAPETVDSAVEAIRERDTDEETDEE